MDGAPEHNVHYVGLLHHLHLPVFHSVSLLQCSISDHHFDCPSHHHLGINHPALPNQPMHAPCLTRGSSSAISPLPRWATVPSLPRPPVPLPTRAHSLRHTPAPDVHIPARSVHPLALQPLTSHTCLPAPCSPGNASSTRTGMAGSVLWYRWTWMPGRSLRHTILPYWDPGGLTQTAGHRDR